MWREAGGNRYAWANGARGQMAAVAPAGVGGMSREAGGNRYAGANGAREQMASVGWTAVRKGVGGKAGRV